VTDAHDDDVKAQYEAWVYPLPIPDIAEAVNDGFFDRSNPALLRRKLWPRNVEPAALEILVAGCGTNQAALSAFTNPECHVVGIDISEASLDHQRLLKDKHELGNLELRQLPVEHVEDLKQSFDYIVSSGVLHHLPEPDRGLRSLRDALAPHGVMTLMLYGYYGRVGVYMVQEALRLLGSEQDADGLEMVRHIRETVPDSHPVSRYHGLSDDVGYDAGLIDMFLHRSDRAYTVPQVLQFARDNGLKFQAWLDNLDYSISARMPEDDILLQRAETLDESEQWALVDLLWAHGTHSFVLCHVDRPESDYILDFTGDAWLDYVPSLRPPMEIVRSQELRDHDHPASASVAISRDFHTVELGRFGIAVLDLVDGATPVRRILDETSHVATQEGWDANDHVEAARFFFQRMAEWDHFQFEIR
jgi:SAM-dependent methyltransferase